MVGLVSIHGFVNSGDWNFVPGGSFEGGLRDESIARLARK
jgi:hypothetical protein